MRSPDCGLTVTGDIAAGQSTVAVVQLKKIYCKAGAYQ